MSTSGISPAAGENAFEEPSRLVRGPRVSTQRDFRIRQAQVACGRRAAAKKHQLVAERADLSWRPVHAGSGCR